MSDYSELKRLAEGLEAHAEDSFYLPCTIAFERAATPAAVLELIAEVEALRKDAERYQWLRANNYYAHVQVMDADGSMPYVYSEELDRSVDFARKGEQP